jgi:aminoglycoside phosphotransferase family enzyme
MPGNVLLVQYKLSYLMMCIEKNEWLRRENVASAILYYVLKLHKTARRKTDSRFNNYATLHPVPNSMQAFREL